MSAEASRVDDVDEIRRGLQKFLSAVSDMHPTYANTSACHGGIGGQAITAHCAVLCNSPKHDKARDAYESGLEAMYRWLQGDLFALGDYLDGAA